MNKFHSLSSTMNSYLFPLYLLQVKVPLYGCDCYAYALLASGFVDLVIESCLKVRYSLLALLPRLTKIRFLLHQTCILRFFPPYRGQLASLWLSPILLTD